VVPFITDSKWARRSSILPFSNAFRRTLAIRTPHLLVRSPIQGYTAHKADQLSTTNRRKLCTALSFILQRSGSC
jgi:hypothetical protein